MSPTMPPVVQRRTPSTPPSAAPKSAAAAAPDPKPEASSFREELVRHRKEKEDKAKSRPAAEGAKTPAKLARTPKARKMRDKDAKSEGEPAGATTDAQDAAG